MSSSASASASSDATTYDCLVLGGGWSGLITALRVLESSPSKPPKVCILEGRERLGGRAFTHTYNQETKGRPDRTVAGTSSSSSSSAGANQDTSGTSEATSKSSSDAIESIDFGCSWIHGYNEGNPVRGICEKLGITSHIAPKAVKPAVIVGSDGQPLDEQLARRIEGNLSQAMEQAKQRATEEASRNLSVADHLFDAQSPLFAGLSSETERSAARSYARSLHVPLGTTLEDVALASMGKSQAYGGTDAAPEGGFSRVIEALADEVRGRGGVIKLQQQVTGIQAPADGAALGVVTNNESYAAHVVACTVPLAVLKQCNSKGDFFSPPLSQSKQQSIQRTSVGNLNKVLLVYDAPWWDVDVSSFVILPSSDSSSSSSNHNASLEDILSSCTLSISASINASTSSAKLLVMVGGPPARRIEDHKRPQVVEALHRLLSSRIPRTSSSAPSPPSHNFMSRWSGHDLTGGATTTPVTLGQGRSKADFLELSKPEYEGRLLFAGEHTEPEHRGSIAGAVVSAEREAKRIVDALKSRL